MSKFVGFNANSLSNLECDCAPCKDNTLRARLEAAEARAEEWERKANEAEERYIAAYRDRDALKAAEARAQSAEAAVRYCESHHDPVSHSPDKDTASVSGIGPDSERQRQW